MAASSSILQHCDMAVQLAALRVRQTKPAMAQTSSPSLRSMYGAKYRLTGVSDACSGECRGLQAAMQGCLRGPSLTTPLKPYLDAETLCDNASRTAMPLRRKTCVGFQGGCRASPVRADPELLASHRLDTPHTAASRASQARTWESDSK